MTVANLTNTRPTIGAADGKFSSPINRSTAVLNIEQALHYFAQYEPHHPVKAMLERALVWIDKPMDTWLSELVSDEASRRKIQDVLGLKLTPQPTF
jgi:type VI secretion system protein ImpA